MRSESKSISPGETWAGRSSGAAGSDPPPVGAAATVMSTAPPRPKDGRKASDLVIDERRHDR